MSEELQAVAPVVPAENTQPAEVANDPAVTQNPDASASSNATTEANKEATTKTETKESGWEQRRIDQLTRKRYEEKARADYAQQRATALEAELAAARGQKPAETPQVAITPEKIQAMVQEHAQELVRGQRFDEASNKAAKAGEKEFPDFAKAVVTLNTMGALFDEKGPTDLADTIMQSDLSHKLLHHLGSNPDEAEIILALPPKLQARQIGLLEARLSQAPAAPTVPLVSKAPAPIVPAGSRANASDAPSDKDDAATWQAKRAAEIAARAKDGNKRR